MDADILFRRKARNGERNKKKNVWTELPMTDKEYFVGNDCRSAEMP